MARAGAKRKHRAFPVLPGKGENYRAARGMEAGGGPLTPNRLRARLALGRKRKKPLAGSDFRPIGATVGSARLRKAPMLPDAKCK